MRVKFGDIVKDVKENVDRSNNPYKFYVAGDHMDSEDFRIHRFGRFATDDVGPAFVRIFHPGQILYGSRRTYLKKVCVADFEGITANTTFVLETKDETVLMQKLLPFLMLSKGFTDWSIKHSKGSTNPYVLFSDLASYEFDLPPLERQKELAELLWAANDLKESYKKMIIATDEMLKAKFREMFGECGRESAKGAGDKVIHDCQIVPLSEVGVISTGSTPSMKNRVYYENHDIPFYKPSDFSHELTSLDCSEFWLDARAERKVRMFHEGAVLVTCIGTIGRVGIAKRSGTCNQQINFIEPNESVYSIFLAHALQMMGEALSDKAKTSVVPIINKGEFSRIKIPLPPLSLQQEFVTIARKADETKAALKQSIADVEQVIKGLINE